MTKHTPEHDLILHERGLILFAMEQGDSSFAEITRSTGLPRRILENRMNKLARDGLITMVSYGKWELVAKQNRRKLPDWPILALKWAGYPVDCRV